MGGASRERHPDDFNFHGAYRMSLFSHCLYKGILALVLAATRMAAAAITKANDFAMVEARASVATGGSFCLRIVVNTPNCLRLPQAHRAHCTSVT